MAASLEFAVIPMQAVRPGVMLQGKIYESAGVVVGERSAVSPLQDDTGDGVASQSRYAGFVILMQWLFWIYSQIKGQGRSCINKQAILYANLSSSQHDAAYFMLRRCLCMSMRCKWHNVVFSQAASITKAKAIVVAVELYHVAVLSEAINSYGRDKASPASCC